MTVSTGATLARIASSLHGHVLGDSSVVLQGIRHDSRRVEHGDLFVARQGERTDGLLFINQAVHSGAAAIMAERGHAPQSCPVPVLLVDDIRLAIGAAAELIYGNPTSSIKVVGITGTNGKTTTSYLARTAIYGSGGRAGVLGTLGAHFEKLDVGADHTTPEADEVSRVASLMLLHGATHMIMEVSSHALAQHRADGIRYEVAAFTNLTQDHLDYHHTLEAYGAAKARLFHELRPARATVNIDDPFASKLAEGLACPLVRVSRLLDAPADVRPCSSVMHDARGMEFDALTPCGKVHLKAPLVGEHNLSNLLLTLAIVCCLDLPIDDAALALSSSPQVPGRLERCDGPHDDIAVLVDYAHTPDALERALLTLRPLTTGRILCVFGCGGDRDRTKRPVMGNVAGRLADVAILTNDNPRSEDPEAIANAVSEGFKNTPSAVKLELDRALAIELAITSASPGDVVLIAGKGHEPYQIVGDKVRHFDDREQARSALLLRKTAKGSSWPP